MIVLVEDVSGYGIISVYDAVEFRLNGRHIPRDFMIYKTGGITTS